MFFLLWIGVCLWICLRRLLGRNVVGLNVMLVFLEVDGWIFLGGCGVGSGLYF